MFVRSMVDRVERVDTTGMHNVLAFAFQGYNDAKEGLPNRHYYSVLNKMVGEGKLVIVENNLERAVFKNNRSGAYVCYVIQTNKTGSRESIEVMARGDPVEAIGRTHGFAMGLLGKCCSGYSGRS